jgi:hypothetical protein
MGTVLHLRTINHTTEPNPNPTLNLYPDITIRNYFSMG